MYVAIFSVNGEILSFSFSPNTRINLNMIIDVLSFLNKIGREELPCAMHFFQLKARSPGKIPNFGTRLVVRVREDFRDGKQAARFEC